MPPCLRSFIRQVVEEGDLFVLGLEQLMKKQPGAASPKTDGP